VPTAKQKKLIDAQNTSINSLPSQPLPTIAIASTKRKAEWRQVSFSIAEPDRELD
jgi:hypothetical protein